MQNLLRTRSFNRLLRQYKLKHACRAISHLTDIQNFRKEMNRAKYPHRIHSTSACFAMNYSTPDSPNSDGYLDHTKYIGPASSQDALHRELIEITKLYTPGYDNSKAISLLLQRLALWINVIESSPQSLAISSWLLFIRFWTFLSKPHRLTHHNALSALNNLNTIKHFTNTSIEMIHFHEPHIEISLSDVADLTKSILILSTTTKLSFQAVTTFIQRVSKILQNKHLLDTSSVLDWIEILRNMARISPHHCISNSVVRHGLAVYHHQLKSLDCPTAANLCCALSDIGHRPNVEFLNMLSSLLSANAGSATLRDMRNVFVSFANFSGFPVSKDKAYLNTLFSELPQSSIATILNFARMWPCFDIQENEYNMIVSIYLASFALKKNSIENSLFQKEMDHLMDSLRSKICSSLYLLDGRLLYAFSHTFVLSTLQASTEKKDAAFSDLAKVHGHLFTLLGIENTVEIAGLLCDLARLGRINRNYTDAVLRQKEQTLLLLFLKKALHLFHKHELCVILHSCADLQLIPDENLCALIENRLLQFMPDLDANLHSMIAYAVKVFPKSSFSKTFLNKWVEDLPTGHHDFTVTQLITILDACLFHEKVITKSNSTVLKSLMINCKQAFSSGEAHDVGSLSVQITSLGIDHYFTRLMANVWFERILNIEKFHPDVHFQIGKTLCIMSRNIAKAHQGVKKPSTHEENGFHIPASLGVRFREYIQQSWYEKSISLLSSGKLTNEEYISGLTTMSFSKVPMPNTFWTYEITDLLRRMPTFNESQLTGLISSLSMSSKNYEIWEHLGDGFWTSWCTCVENKNNFSQEHIKGMWIALGSLCLRPTEGVLHKLLSQTIEMQPTLPSRTVNRITHAVLNILPLETHNSSVISPYTDISTGVNEKLTMLTTTSWNTFISQRWDNLTPIDLGNIVRNIAYVDWTKENPDYYLINAIRDKIEDLVRYKSSLFSRPVLVNLILGESVFQWKLLTRAALKKYLSRTTSRTEVKFTHPDFIEIQQFLAELFPSKCAFNVWMPSLDSKVFSLVQYEDKVLSLEPLLHEWQVRCITEKPTSFIAPNGTFKLRSRLLGKSNIIHVGLPIREWVECESDILKKEYLVKVMQNTSATFV